MNTGWYSRLDFSNPMLQSFMDNCNLIATSCTEMAHIMSRNLPWSVDCISNGSYNFDKLLDSRPDWSKRENKIITVARLGTQQKRTDILLLSFAAVTNLFPGWKLELIGTIEDSFKPIMEQVMNAFPELNDRVEFTGFISDRKLLAEKYRTAKIFALPSEFEGGTPNAAAYAVSCGCVICTTLIDAWEDMIHSGRCGRVAPIGDQGAFARTLFELMSMSSPELEKMSDDAYEWGKEFYDMEKNVDKIMTALLQ